MRWDNWAAITVATAIALVLHLAAGARFDDPMTSLLESIREDDGRFSADDAHPYIRPQARPIT